MGISNPQRFLIPLQLNSEISPALDPKDSEKRYENPQDAFMVWLEEIQREYVGREGIP